jgi:hypothetical protein
MISLIQSDYVYIRLTCFLNFYIRLDLGNKTEHKSLANKYYVLFFRNYSWQGSLIVLSYDIYSFSVVMN